MSLIKEYRDLSILPISKGKSLVIACDSSAGIGKKEHDAVEIDPAITAAFCLRVPLMELLCYGAEPIAVIDLIGNEYAPTGERMLKGIREELARAELSNITLNGSTEENMFTKTTSVGITVVAETKAGKENFQMQSPAIRTALCWGTGCEKSGNNFFLSFGKGPKIRAWSYRYVARWFERYSL